MCLRATAETRVQMQVLEGWSDLTLQRPPPTRRILDGLRRATELPGLDPVGDDRKA
jgi:hypothetical protein